MGRALIIEAQRRPSSVDESLLREALRLTPGERLERHDRSYPELRRWANEAQAAVARVA